MRILHIIAGISKRSGGPTYALLNILKAERALAYYNEVLTLSGPGIEDQIPQQAKTWILDPTFPRRYSRSGHAIRWLKQNVSRFDVVHIHGIWSFLSLESGLVCSGQRVRFIYHGHGSLDPFDLRKKLWLKKVIGNLIYRRLFEKAAAFFCTADDEADRLVTYGARTKRLVVPLTVDYFPQNGSRERFRSRYDLGQKDFVLLFLSRIDYKKGLEILIPAFAQLLVKFPDLKLVLAGADSRGYEVKVKQQVRRFILDDKIIFTGMLQGEQKADAYAAADLFVLPSQNENFGVAVVEALQCGLPVLISKNVYIHMQIAGMNGGWVCDYSVQSVAEALEHILTDFDDFQSKKKHAFAAGEHYATRNLVATYREFYEAVVQSREH